jgi:hypothetical protein
LLLPADSARDSTRALTVSGFIDLYYAYDLGRPSQRDRAFTTQAVRHNEINVNLAHVALAVERDRVRGRLAFQAGTAVQVNYAGEPAIGAASGSSLSRHLQEATAGVRLSRTTWLDAGIYFSYIGWEGWISRDNPTYSRSLVADYTPYYESGIRLSWQPDRRFSLQGHLMNGWQKISEDNDSKAVGLRMDFAVTPRFIVAYGGFLGNEQPAGSARATRLFNQLMLKAEPSARLLLQGQLDYGREAARGVLRDWYGAVLIARLSLASRVATSARIERFADPDQVVAPTGEVVGLVATGGSLGVDVSIPGGVLWRLEARALHARSALFPKHGVDQASRSNAALLTSLALTL